MNCIVGWNPTEKSWDCPCHGGRFDAEGHVLNGPPVTDLQPVDKDGP
jgi:Rieske Fe-S protein